MKKQIVLLSAKTVIATDLLRRLKENTQVDCRSFTYRPEVVEFITKNQTDAIVMMDLDNSRDISLILRGIKFSLNPNDTKVIILSEDLNQAAKVYDDFEDLNIQILSLHESIETIVKEIHVHIFEELRNSLVEEGKKAESTSKEQKLDVRMNMEFLKVFIDATKDVVFQMSGDSTISHDKPTFLTSMTQKPDIGIRSRIEIASEHFKGSFFISFPAETYLNFVELVLGERRSQIDDEIKDFILELGNIVYGQSKRILNSSGFHLEMKIPEYYEKDIVSHSPIFVIPYSTKFGPFYIKVAPNLL